MRRNIATRLAEFKARARSALRRFPFSAGIHATAAVMHTANGDYVAGAVALCRAIAAIRHL